MACLLPDTLPFVTAERLLGWQTQAAPDTRPCPALVAHARGAGLLIHEAYGLEGAAAEAHRFGHSTAADAGAAAREAGAGHLLLTHFRADRYAAPSALKAEAEVAFGRSVELARDLEVVDV